MNNIYKQMHQEAKARKLADEIAAAGIGSEKLVHFTDQVWEVAANRAGVKMPSDWTKELVGQFLREREAAARRAA